MFLFTISYISCSSSITTSRSLSSLAFFVHQEILLVHIIYLANCFAFICDAEVSPHSTRTVCHTTKSPVSTSPIQFCMHVAGMHMHRLARAQVWNAIITTKYYMMSCKLIQPAMNIGIGMANLIANIIVYLQYRQIVV